MKNMDRLCTLTKLHARLGMAREIADRFCPEGTALREYCGAETEFNIDGKKVKGRRPVCGSHLMLAEAERQWKDAQG